MSFDRTQIVEQAFLDALKQDKLPPPLQNDLGELTKSDCFSLFDSAIKSRLLDLKARGLKQQGEAFYTIASSGHEGNGVFGLVFPYTDMAFLHYRSGAFFIQRAKQLVLDGVEAILLSLVAAKEDIASGGRHKVFGSKALNLPPQTSTIASHLPKAMGAALALSHRGLNKEAEKTNKDRAILCSFGDASINHASAQTTFNAASKLTDSCYPLPLIFICEDNGLGISVKTPAHWVAKAIQGHANIAYIPVDGRNLLSLFNGAKKAQRIASIEKRPVFLHMRCPRLFGHAGSDIEQQYLSLSEIESSERQCPILAMAATLKAFNLMTGLEMRDYYLSVKEDIDKKSLAIIKRPKLTSKQQVMASLYRNNSKCISPPLPPEAQRKAIFADKYNQLALKRSLQQSINLALTDLLLRYPNALIFGEDVGKKGGVYRVSADLQRQFGKHRVFDTILDETTILGTAIGYAHMGFLPVPEIQFLAYLHNSEDQLRGEAATLSFFSDGQFVNPLLLRLPSFAYQKGFGGHFHNDNSIAVLRDIPGVVLACPSNGESAVKLLRHCFKLCYEQGRIVVFLEPIALYMTKDLLEEGDNLWLFDYPSLEQESVLGEVLTIGQGENLIITYGNGYYLSRKAQALLQQSFKIDVKVLDLQWLKPLPVKALLQHAIDAKRILIVDEGRRTGSISEEIITVLVENLTTLPPIRRLTGEDCFIPIGEAWQTVLPNTEDIINAMRELINA